MADAVTVDQIVVGDHACLTFTEPDERMDLVAEFVADGLQLGQRIICFTDSVQPDDLIGELVLREVAARDAIHRGQLALRGSQDSWLAGGPVTAKRMLSAISDEMRHAESRGFPGLRVTADMCWATRAVVAADQLVAFERQAADLFAHGQLAVICQYDRDIFDPVTLAFAADAHPKTVAALAYHDTPLLRICRQHRPPGLRIAGELDSTHLEPLQHALAETFRLDHTIHVNLTRLRFIDVTAATAIAKAALTLPTDRTMIVTCPPVIAAIFDALGAAQAPQMRIQRSS
ncbi:anti-anti-sigma regulatory factor [Allocatelliglobosispora scoriae]|uniref:Anti-anti-sigma regulatory factor n=1 Tax=Allocatelliglobosispora scoriae TaxID=643052 RepID=A0A841BRQ8_9ACTN|nr:MEDS domain-containing protein [Allocatelliglobosispora scoriae]MBB5871737.1 anti-anti-sigma regulatory factor [Allocatelliglobosispora scoriae]